MRYLIATMAGVVVAFGIIIALDALGHVLFPSFVIDPNMKKEEMAAVIEGLPLAAKLWVAGTWIVATLLGGLLASRIARDKTALVAGIVGALVLAATTANLMMIPHPTWVAAVGLLGIVLAAYFAGRRRA